MSFLQVSSSSYLWLDLGAGKVVHKFALAATVTSATLKDRGRRAQNGKPRAKDGWSRRVVVRKHIFFQLFCLWWVSG